MRSLILLFAAVVGLALSAQQADAQVYIGVGPRCAPPVYHHHHHHCYPRGYYYARPQVYVHPHAHYHRGHVHVHPHVYVRPACPGGRCR